METDLTVIPAQAGIHGYHYCLLLDPGLRRDDELDWRDDNRLIELELCLK